MVVIDQILRTDVLASESAVCDIDSVYGVPSVGN